jgi:hypothetical protein
MRRTSGTGDTPAGRSRPHAEADRLCPGCRDRLAEDLAELSELYEMCVFAVELGDHRRQPGSQHPVVAIQSEVSRVLASWCDTVAGERGVAAPEESDVHQLAAFLMIHLDWLSGRPSAAGLADELDELASAIREALRPSGQYRSLWRNEN